MTDDIHEARRLLTNYQRELDLLRWSQRGLLRHVEALIDAGADAALRMQGSGVDCTDLLAACDAALAVVVATKRRVA